MMYRGHIPKRKEDSRKHNHPNRYQYRGQLPKRTKVPEPTKDTAMSCVVAAAFVGGFVILILHMFYC